jgi:hypothetical protein
MKYYKYDDEEGCLDGGVAYVEVGDGCVWRQVSVRGERTLVSSIQDPEHGLVLADVDMDWADLEDVTEVSPSEFESAWALGLRSHRSAWDASKRAHAVGASVQGQVLMFYPQGVLVDLGAESLGIADFDECRAANQDRWPQCGQVLSAVVSGYDEKNHWLVLGEPRMHACTRGDRPGPGELRPPR